MPYYPPPSSAAVNIKQTEIDFGATPVSGAEFTITDADVTTSSQVIGSKALLAPTGRHVDEARVEELSVACGNGSGSFPMEVTSLVGRVTGKFHIQYLVG